jgi:hypothetical protein
VFCSIHCGSATLCTTRLRAAATPHQVCSNSFLLRVEMNPSRLALFSVLQCCRVAVCATSTRATSSGTCGPSSVQQRREWWLGRRGLLSTRLLGWGETRSPATRRLSGTQVRNVDGVQFTARGVQFVVQRLRTVSESSLASRLLCLSSMKAVRFVFIVHLSAYELRCLCIIFPGTVLGVAGVDLDLGYL